MQEILKHITLPEETEKVVIDTYNKICVTEEYKKIRQMIDAKERFEEIRKVCASLSESSGINEYTVCMAVLVCNADIARQRYINKGVSLDVFYETAQDLRYKSNICKKYMGVQGIFVFEWFEKFYEVKIFKLGRLQFVEIPVSDKKNYIAVHIPEDGRLCYSDVLASYNAAYKFFPKTQGDLMVFVCHSYFFLPEYKGTVYKEGSNTYRFIEDYTVLECEYTENFGDAWRIFDMDYTGDTSVLPRNSSLQKAFIEHIEKVGKFGEGKGAFAFDGEKIKKLTAEEIKQIIS